MQNTLLIYEDDSFDVLSTNEYIRWLSVVDLSRKPVKQEIFRDSLPGISGERLYVSRVRSANSRWMSLSEFPEEIRSLLILYEI